MTRTGKSARLSSHLAEPFVEINPADAMELGIGKASLVKLENGFGSAVLRALLTDRQPRGSVFVPMHWNDEYAARGRIDALVAPRTDPVSGQPALKHVGIDVRPAEMAFHGFAVTAFRPEKLDSPYWAVAKAEAGWRVEFGFSELPEDIEQWCRDRFGLLYRGDHLAYADNTSGQQRHGFFDGSRLLAAFYLSPGPVAVSRDWAVKQLGVTHDTPRARFALLAGRPGADQMDPGATVCSCFSVGINQIVAAIAGGCHTVDAVGKALNAGTNCGSCRVEIKGIIDGCVRQAAE
jgi:assimilatory nitrate reductase catalytic subunit